MVKKAKLWCKKFFIEHASFLLMKIKIVSQKVEFIILLSLFLIIFNFLHNVIRDYNL